MAAHHTPGPWRVSVSNRGTLCVVSSDTWICGELSNGNSEDTTQTRANALLIAAAPLMREALLAVRAACRDPDTDTALPIATGELVEAALAAMGERS